MISTASTSANRILSLRAASKQAERFAPSRLCASQAHACSLQQRSSFSTSSSPSSCDIQDSGLAVKEVRNPFSDAKFLVARPSFSSILLSIVKDVLGRSTVTSTHAPQLALASPAQTISEKQAEGQESGGIFSWDGLLWAVPKKKVSHSRKAMRSANKGLKDRVDFVHCQGCGRPKLAHHICSHCFSQINRWQKQDFSPKTRRA